MIFCHIVILKIFYFENELHKILQIYYLQYFPAEFGFYKLGTFYIRFLKLFRQD